VHQAGKVEYVYNQVGEFEQVAESSKPGTVSPLSPWFRCSGVGSRGRRGCWLDVDLGAAYSRRLGLDTALSRAVVSALVKSTMSARTVAKGG
jgi:hypothetical protein